MVQFMESTAEAQYLSVVHNWRRASDEQGLSAEMRQPWHKDKDFGVLEVNR